jgi:signal transduction histidine kinase
MSKPAAWLIVPFVLVVLAGTMAVNHDNAAKAAALAVPLVAIATLAVLLHRSNPRATLLLNAAAVTAYLALDFSNGPVYLTLPLVTFFVALVCPPQRWIPAAVAAVALTGAGLVVRDLYSENAGHFGDGLWPWFGVAGLVSAAGAIATTTRTRREANAERTRRAATEERLRMAQDLHDGVGHGLAVIAMQAGVALHVLDQDPAAARESLLAIRDTSKESLDALRAELSVLTPGQPLTRAPRRGLADLDVLVDRVRAGGLPVSVDSSRPSRPVPSELDETAYVVVQESLTNVLRHANAGSAHVAVTENDGSLLVTVTDDGQGGAVPEDNAGGMGISGMRTRAERVGGTLEAGPTATGFRVRASLPFGAR